MSSALTVPCPRCHINAGHACRSTHVELDGSRTVLLRSHPQRVLAAKATSTTARESAPSTPAHSHPYGAGCTTACAAYLDSTRGVAARAATAQEIAPSTSCQSCDGTGQVTA